MRRRSATQETKEAEDQRCKQQEGQDLIKPASGLDFAITAGKAPYDALEVLRRELVAAKFLGYLTTLRSVAVVGQQRPARDQLVLAGGRARSAARPLPRSSTRYRSPPLRPSGKSHMVRPRPRRD